MFGCAHIASHFSKIATLSLCPCCSSFKNYLQELQSGESKSLESLTYRVDSKSTQYSKALGISNNTANFSKTRRTIYAISSCLWPIFAARVFRTVVDLMANTLVMQYVLLHDLSTNSLFRTPPVKIRRIIICVQSFLILAIMNHQLKFHSIFYSTDQSWNT